ncbi:MAG: hypothetical protein ACKOHI_07125, partial [Phycisphaerales bacterium]
MIQNSVMRRAALGSHPCVGFHAKLTAAFPPACASPTGRRAHRACLVAALAGGLSLHAPADGPLTAWGANEAGQCDLPSNLGVVRAALGGATNNWGSLGYSVALRPDGSVIAWGSNARGMCNVPIDARDVVQISASAMHA